MSNYLCIDDIRTDLKKGIIYLGEEVNNFGHTRIEINNVFYMPSRFRKVTFEDYAIRNESKSNL